MREMNEDVNNDTNNTEARLSKALRSLATTLPGSAPPEVGDALARAFRRHHARRRMVRRSALAAAIVILVALPAVLVLSRRQGVETPSHNAGGAVSNAPSPPAVHSDPLLPKIETTSRSRIHRRPVATKTKMNPVARRDDFVPLPSYSLRSQAEDLRIVRLQVNGRDLRLVGAPVSGDMDERPVLADFVVGQDGTPYAVRLLRQNVR
jgi:hypothetical protein